MSIEEFLFNFLISRCLLVYISQYIVPESKQESANYAELNFISNFFYNHNSFKNFNTVENYMLVSMAIKLRSIEYKV